jgi:hypothetical protein
LKKFNLLLLVLVFSLLLGGCSGSGDSGDQGTPAGSQAHSIKAILPSAYSTSTNPSVTLPTGKSFVIITNGYNQRHQQTIQQHLTFGKTGSEDIKINIPDLKGAIRLIFQIQISLDSQFDNKETWDKASKTNLVAGFPTHDGNDRYFDSNITSIEFKLAKQ